MNSALKPAPKGFALSANEEDRRKWTERLDQELPHYRQSKRELGRILKELKAIYCRPGCQGLWRPFLESRGFAMSTANDLIARYDRQENIQDDSDSTQPGEGASLDPTAPSKSFQMKLTIPPEYRSDFKQAFERLGRDRASEVIYAAVLQAAEEADLAAAAEDTEAAEMASRAPESAGHSPEEREVEVTGSGNFNLASAELNRDLQDRNNPINTFEESDFTRDSHEDSGSGDNRALENSAVPTPYPPMRRERAWSAATGTWTDEYYDVAVEDENA